MKSKLQELSLRSPLTDLKGVGSARADALGRLGLFSIEDLLYFFPRRYEDRRTLVPLASAVHDAQGAFRAVVLSWSRLRSPKKGVSMLRASLSDGQSVAGALWFGRPGLERALQAGTELALWGKVNRRGNRVELINPELEVLRGGQEPTIIGTILPIYPGTAQLPDRWLRELVSRAVDFGVSQLTETLPESLISERGWLDAKTAVLQMHRPTSRSGWLAARTRLAFEEFLWLQIGLALRRAGSDKEARAPRLDGLARPLRQAFLDRLGFSLTDDQRRATAEIDEDLMNPAGMNRLLQGDVGSGKTAVALLAMLRAVESGKQAVLMAPTQVLAFQHWMTVRRWLDPLGVKTALLAGGLKQSEKEEILTGLADGTIDLAIGTHALVQEGVDFADLGVVVIDEQHRFGVLQRRTLSARSGGQPHRLVMTATPIPRTLALSIYGDLSLSTLRHKPAGRLPIRTSWVSESKRPDLLNWLEEQMDGGRQVYWICPIIEESEELPVAALEARFAELKARFGAERTGMLHGRMTSDEKTAVMEDFSAGRLTLLAATTVIEVGVDVPNATVMVIEDAERFGLSQLHQLRGRVGRGDRQSWCFLLSHAGGPSAERLRAFCRTDDGFAIADLDMSLRGPGEFCGVRQHGITDFRVADLVRDVQLMEDAQKTARKMVQAGTVPDGLMEQVRRRYGTLLELAETA